jgi:tRNA pseudouridine38-40 synthase
VSTVRLDLAYDGTAFAGWAVQPGQRTVQGELEAALAQVLNGRVSLTVAGRTDAGVHAWGQVASFSLPGQDPPFSLRRALNSLTGPDLAILGVEKAPEGFDARRDARSRTYCYRLFHASQASPFERGRSLHWPHEIYPAMLQRCAEALVGTHDFTAFTPTQTEHVRFERDVFRAEWVRGRSHAPQRSGENEELLEFWIEADAFMRSMVRVLVGTMLEVGSRRRPFDSFTDLLKGAPRDQAGDTAQPHGLYLASVTY